MLHVAMDAGLNTVEQTSENIDTATPGTTHPYLPHGVHTQKVQRIPTLPHPGEYWIRC